LSGCWIGGNYVAPGTGNATCQVCNPATNATGWTDVAGITNGGFEYTSNPTWTAGASYDGMFTAARECGDHKRNGNCAARLGWFTNYVMSGDYATVYATVNLTGVSQITYYTATGKTNATPSLKWNSECWVGGSANIARNGTRIGNFALANNINGGSSWTLRTVTVPVVNRTTNQVLKFVNYIETGASAAFGYELFYNYIDDVSFSCGP